MHRSAVMQNSLKLGVSLSRNDTKNAKNTLVCGHGKMPKSSRSAVTNKCQKVAGPGSWKNAKNSLVRSHKKMPKTHKSTVTKIQKMHSSAVMKKSRKLAVPFSRNETKSSKKSQVRGHEKIQKTHWLAVLQKCLKLALPLSRNDTKNA